MQTLVCRHDARWRTEKSEIGGGLHARRTSVQGRNLRNYVSLLELDEKSPTVQVLLRVCRALGVKAAKIISRVEG